MHHSVLGERSVYDACTDAVGVSAFLTTILTGGRQADLELQSATGASHRSSPTTAQGSGRDRSAPRVRAFTASVVGTTTVVRTDAHELVVEHVLGGASPADVRETLIGQGPDHDPPTLLAYVR